MNDDRFKLNSNDISILSKNDEYLKGNDLIKYLEAERAALTNVEEKLNIGDVVRLRFTGDIVTIKDNSGEMFSYKGSVEGVDDRLILFDQNDIEEIISKKK